MTERIETLSADSMADLKRKAQQFGAVRQAIGYLGLALPFVMIAYSTWTGTALLDSMSDYYHSAVGDIFVGVLCAMGIFLVAYLGYDNSSAPEDGNFIQRLTDRQVSTVAGIAAVGVGLFPVTAPVDMMCNAGCAASGFTEHSFILHYVAAGIFFFSTAIFCFELFPRGNSSARRRAYFHMCGALIAAAIVGLVLVVIWGALNEGFEDPFRLFFWFEVLAVFAFAVAWLEKGRSPLSPGRLMI